ncbi:tripartite motif-containing protein 16-like isoform X1 [Onychostoma macrolepis]|uniref:tripartite motif-containing protein 16-like isoform X1 n=1 Tax=Onychostoma macrolepis TaxID=369639 RepID=UPI00272C0CDB|nr:tripartite motif-containing protein 16-like isoform X1 [Onychostoma macrolepis]
MQMADEQDLQENSCPRCKQNSSCETDPGEYEAPAADLDDSNASVSDPDESVACVAEALERTGLQTEQAEDVECDSCSDRKEKAIKTCLVCLASYCETHLRLHNELNARKAHLLVDITGELQRKTCPQHHKLLEVYCRTDRQCICCLCMLDTNHRGHDMVSAATERAEEQRQLEKSKQMVMDLEAELKEIQKASGRLRQNLTQTTEEEGDRIFTELLSFIRTSHTEMITLVQSQMTTELNRIQGHLVDLEQEISKLKRKQSEVEHLSHTDDHIYFLQEVQSRWPTCNDFQSLTTNPQFSFGEVIKSLSSLTGHIKDIWRQETTRIFSAVTAEKILLPQEPKTREDFIQFLVPLSLDPNTVHRNLRLTEQNQAVACSIEPQSYPEHPDRFEWWAQVLSKEGLTGRCYWEVVWSGLYGVDLAVSYKDINRTGQGDDSGFGYNRYSWSLDCSIFRYALVHNNEETEISVPLSRRIGVYLDHRAGQLSFYSVSDTMILLHKVQTRFTQPLYPGFGLFQGSTAKIGQPQEGGSTQVVDRLKNNKTCINHRCLRTVMKSNKCLRFGKRGASSPK